MSGGAKSSSSSAASTTGPAALTTIPAASRKMVQSLKEVVSCSELEIYDILKECNMDPNETVYRLLSQDRFHEVKSKREKKKESKDTSESRSRGGGNTGNRGGNTGNRGGRSNVERYSGRGSSTQFSSTDSGFHGKSAYKKENGTNAHTNSSSSAPRMAGNNMSSQPLSWSDSVPKENKISTIGAGDNTFSSSQPSGYQPAWGGVPGQLSMADIVKMGRPPAKASSTINHSHHITEPPSTIPHHDWHSSQDYNSNDEWPIIEQPLAAAMSSVVEEPVDSDGYADTSNFARTNQNHEYHIDDDHVQEDGAGESYNPNFVRPGSASSRSVQEENPGSASHYDNEMYNMKSYQPHTHAFEHQEDGGASLSSVSASLQQLSLQKDETGAPPEDDDRVVVIPDHLQVLSGECIHLSFGSFGSGAISAGASTTFSSRPFKSDVEETSTAADTSSVGNPDRNLEYYGDEHLITTSDGNLDHRTSVGTESYNSHSASQPEVLKQDIPEVGEGNQYVFPSSAPGYTTFENNQQLNAAYVHSNSQMQNMAPFSSVMQAYTNSLPNTLLASTVHPTRESDLPYSPFSVSQSVPTKYNNTASSLTGSSISMSEGLKTGNFSASQQTQQTQPGGNVATGPALPQHLVHPYSQPTLPLGPFSNMIGYPFLPQSYTYMPSAFQQAFGGNSSYHQSLAAAVLPQYKNNISVSNLPQSAAIASGYGAFGNSTNVPGNFPMNPPSTATAPAAGTTVGYDDIINSQYKDASHLLSLQQGDNSAMWVHGTGSRTMSAVPANTYYNFQSQQNQQPAAYRQAQQQQQPPSQQFGAHGYPNYYQSQTGLSLEHQQQQLQLQLQLQQQNLRDGSIGGSQGQQSKQSQQMWQNNY